MIRERARLLMARRPRVFYHEAGIAKRHRPSPKYRGPVRRYGAGLSGGRRVKCNSSPRETLITGARMETETRKRERGWINIMWRNIIRMNPFLKDGRRRSHLMAGGMLTLVLCLALSSPVLSATDTGGDLAEGSGDTVAILQQRVSEDIAGSKDAVEAELKDFPLGSADVALRMKQLVKLTASASEDAVQWGYTDAEREFVRKY